MVEIWVRLIESGEKEFSECLAKIKDAVKAKLIEDGYLEDK